MRDGGGLDLTEVSEPPATFTPAAATLTVMMVLLLPFITVCKDGRHSQAQFSIS